MRKIGSVIGALFFAFLILPRVALGETRVDATMDRVLVNKGERVILTITVSSNESVNVQEPQVSGIPGLKVVNQWSGTEARSTFSNGKFQTVRSRKFNYQMSVQKVGLFKVPELKVFANGKEYKTKPINVKVVASGAPRSKGSQFGRRNDPFLGADPFADADDLFNQLLGRRAPPSGGSGGSGGSAQVDIDEKDLFSVQMEVDKTEAYQGEQVTVSWFLYTRGQIRDIDTLKYPSLNGFWKEDIHVATHLNFQREIVNGVAYRKALLASYALFPIKVGKATIDPYEAKVTAFANRNGFGFGFGRPVVSVKKSRTQEINVLPLPQPQPENFVGTVGNFRVTARADQQVTEVNQPVSYKIHFSGRGNAKLIELPELEFPPELEFYDTKKESKFSKTGQSHKEFDLLLIPRRSGTFTIPAMTFSFFDPRTKAYTSQTLPPYSITVNPSKGEKVIPSAPIAKSGQSQEPVLKKKGLVPLLEWKSSSSLVSGMGFSPGLMALLFAFLGVILGFKAKKELGWGQSALSLEHHVKSRFEAIHSLVKKGEWRSVGVETTNTIYFALGEVAGDGGASLETEKLMKKVPPSVRREVGAEIERLMSEFQELGFAPEEVIGPQKEKSHMKKNVKKIEELLLRAISSKSSSDSAGKE